MRTSRTAVVFVAALIGTAMWMPAAHAVGPGGWDHLGVGTTAAIASLNGNVTAIDPGPPGEMYVGGDFTSAGGNDKARRIARWDGSSWTSLGNHPITNGGVFAITHHDGKVYAGGTFHNAGGHARADFLAVWDGSDWAPFCTSVAPGSAFSSGTVDALQIIGNTLYVGGSFQNGAQIPSADYLVACDLTTGAASSTVLADGDFEGGVYALTADTDGNLYAGGQFINVANIPQADHVARYDGTWHAMDDGIDTFVRSLHAVGTDVYVGTDAVNVGGVAQADHVVRWNGSAWSAVGTNTAGTDGWFPASSFINAITSYGSILVAGGSFQDADGNPKADGIAYFDGSDWRPVGSDGSGNGPLNAQTNALAVFRGQLYAGGSFTAAGGDTLCRSVASHSLRQPDVLIAGAPSGPFAGNGVYSATGAGEARTVRVAHHHTANVYIRIENDGLVPTSFTVSGHGDAAGISGQYFVAGNNVTGGVRAGTFTTTTVPPRADVTLRLSVSAGGSSSANGTTFVVTARSTPGTTPDAVRAVVKVH